MITLDPGQFSELRYMFLCAISWIQVFIRQIRRGLRLQKAAVTSVCWTILGHRFFIFAGCQIFSGRAPVALSRRFPFRRHILDRCPFSWIYARLFGLADGSCPLSLLSWPFFVERAPGALSRRVLWANALSPDWMNGWTLVKLDAH